MVHSTSWEVLCLGDSLTRGRLGADWIRPLEASIQQIASRGAPVKVVNAGADAALTESLPHRLHAALRRHPEAHALVLLLGTNDILARLHPLPHHLLKLQNGFRGEFLGPQEFGEAVATAVRTLPRSMPVAVLAVPPIGEDLDSVSNATVRQYNAALETAISRVRSATFLDLYGSFARVLRETGHASGPVKSASRDSSVTGFTSGREMAADDLSPTSAMASRRSSFASSTGGMLGTTAGKDAGFRDVALREGETLPDVIELEAMTDVDKLQLGDTPREDAARGVPSTGRDSIGKTSLQAAAKAAAGGVKRSSGGVAKDKLAAHAGAVQQPDRFRRSFALGEPPAPTLAEIQDKQQREASLGFSMSAWPVTVAAALLKHWLLRASWDSVAHGNGLLLLSDNVHLSDCGAEIIAAEVRAYLDRILIPVRQSAYAGAAGHDIGQ